MSQSELKALLGRSLTAREVANLETYLEIASEKLEELLCISLTQETSERVFEARNGYRTVFTGIFTDVSSVTVDGEVVTDYHVSFFDDRNKGFYNSIVFKDKLKGEDVTVNADWGFDTVPRDLKQFWAQLFALTAKKKTLGSVKSKQVEDFRTTYGDLTDEAQLVADNESIMTKYAMCDIFGTRHGSVCVTHEVLNCAYCI